ncbi:hypothetical protein ACFQ1L_10595 [Phytohabitans flavus]|nr:hypothetical protein [Phytohabitans flavus]
MGIRRALVVLVAAALLGGCAGTDDSSGGDAVAPSSSSSAPSPSASPSFPEDLPTPTPSGKPSGGGSIEVSGTVVQGVEMGCRLIDQYLLMAGPGINKEDLRIGAQLTVRGQVEQGMMTTCQQGTPFVVTEIVSR